MKKIIAFFIAAGVCMQVSAQNQEDIFRYSNQKLLGSARTLGLGGAWGAVGADLSAASFNPAGLGLYRRNEFMGSIAVTSNISKTEYNGNLMSDNRTNFNIPNFGGAFTFIDQEMGKPKTTGIVGGTLAFGMNRINDFQSNILYSGTGKNTTVGNYLANQANGLDSSNMWSSDYDNTLFAQAWRFRLIDNNNSPNQYSSILDLLGDSSYSVRQYQQIQTRGKMNEWYAGGGLNVANFLYLGASLVVQGVRFKSDRTYNETLTQSSVSGLYPDYYKSAVITESLETTGSGVGGKFGVILRPVDFIRFGASFHTPVRLNLHDYYQNSLTMNYAKGDQYSEPGRRDEYKYQIITPAKVTASGTIVLGKFMILAADYERIDYRKGRLQSKDAFADFSGANQANRDIYGISETYKAGLEFAAGYTRLRAGYAVITSPYDEKYLSKSNGMKQIISAGFGWIYDNAYFFDFAVNDRIGKDYLTPYDGNPTTAINTHHQLNFTFGAGYRF
jgi:hypothetical protein